MIPFNEHWSEIEANFDFEKVKKVMDFLQWEWHDVGIPSLKQIKEWAKTCCERVYLQGGTHRSGGFVAFYDRKEDAMELSFVVSGWGTNEI